MAQSFQSDNTTGSAWVESGPSSHRKLSWGKLESDFLAGNREQAERRQSKNLKQAERRRRKIQRSANKRSAKSAKKSQAKALKPANNSQRASAGNSSGTTNTTAKMVESFESAVNHFSNRFPNFSEELRKSPELSLVLKKLSDASAKSKSGLTQNPPQTMGAQPSSAPPDGSEQSSDGQPQTRAAYATYMSASTAGSSPATQPHFNTAAARTRTPSNKNSIGSQRAGKHSVVSMAAPGASTDSANAQKSPSTPNTNPNANAMKKKRRLHPALKFLFGILFVIFFIPAITALGVLAPSVFNGDLELSQAVNAFMNSLGEVTRVIGDLLRDVVQEILE